jgi:hypothetical protein
MLESGAGVQDLGEHGLALGITTETGRLGEPKAQPNDMALLVGFRCASPNLRPCDLH